MSNASDSGSGVKRLKYVLEPITIGSCTIPNRVVRTAHFTCLGNGVMSDDLIAYHVARAKGGCGLTILEVCSVHRSSPVVFGRPVLSAWDKALDDGYRKLMAAVKPYGMKVFQQLWHGGHQSIPPDGTPPWSASDIPSSYAGVVPHAMTQSEIRDVVNGFAHAARLCEEAGLDGVEIHGMGGYLITQFMSPLTNKRTDEYGGEFKNRIRFPLEILRAVRAAVSKDFPVGIRLGTEEKGGGLVPDDITNIVKAIQEDGLASYFSLTMGGWFNFHKHVGGMHEAAGYQLDRTAQSAAVSKVPTIVVGRFRTLEEADQVIRTGVADMVAMTRAHIADPDIVVKSREGRDAEVRPCIGCNQTCVGGMMIEGRIGCTINAAAGWERYVGEDKLQMAEQPKNVLVVGGGPAGLEAARVAALRGHRVTLKEARPKLGGVVVLTRPIPHFGGFSDIVDWQEQQLERLGVEVQRNCYVEADEIMQMKPDVVIIATGSTERMDGWQSTTPGRAVTGIQQPHVTSATELLSNVNFKIGKTAVVADDVGHFEGPAIAEYLMSKGAAITFVTGKSSFAPLMESALRAEPALERLSKGNFTLITRADIHAIHEKTVEVKCGYDDTITTVAAETVVMVGYNKPENSLVDGLKDFRGQVLVVGDAVGPRFLRVAIHEGYRAGSVI